MNSLNTMTKTKKINGRKHYLFNCNNCHKDFYRRSDRIKSTDITKCVDCTRSLNGRNSIIKVNERREKTGKYHDCDWCGESVYVQPAKQRWRDKTNQKHNFCDRDCYLEWYREKFNNENLIKSVDNRGKNNGNYKHGKRIGRGGDPKRKLKEGIIKRDGKGCFLCGSEDYLHVHRIMPGGEYSVSNTVILCRNHHALVHKNINKWTKAFADYTSAGREWRKQKRKELISYYERQN